MVDDAVAIVGMGAIFPGAPDLATYWHNIEHGVDAITEVPPTRWEPCFYDPSSTAPDRVYCNRGGFVDEFASFDPTQFGIMPITLEAAEPDQLLALRVAAEAIGDAGGLNALGAPERVGVILGRGGYLAPGMARFDQRVRVAQQLVESLRELVPGIEPERLAAIKAAFQDQLGPARPEGAIDLVPNLAASRIANRFDLQGPAYTVDAACASSLLAVDLAVQELGRGRCDAVVTGGVHHCHDVAFWAVFSQLRALSARQQIRPFDRAADGLLIGEGTGMLVLKRLVDAERAGDRVYAVVRGTGTASDGRASSIMKPRVAGQLLALERAWRASGLDPRSVGLVEAHGTATPVGDDTELDTMARFFGPAEHERAVLGSVKSMIGHTMAAAGAAALIKTALALHHGVLPPTLHCDDPHPRFQSTRFRPLAHAEPWPHTPPGTVPLAGVSAFGFGGISAHVVLEGCPGSSGGRAESRSDRRLRRASEDPPRLPVERVVLLAADDADAMLALLDDERILVDRDDTAAPPDGRWRVAIVGPTARNLELARKVVARGTPWLGRNDLWFSNRALIGRGGKVAFVFPGVEPNFEPHVEDVAAHFNVPRPEIRRDGGLVEHAVDIIAVGRLLDGALRELGLEPDLVAGHSIGEWSAMIAARVVPSEGIASLVRYAIAEDIELPAVVFAALGCGADAAAAAVADLPDIVVSHDNCPHQAIVCGSEASVAVAIARMRDRQTLAQELPFRSGFHSPMLAPFLGPARVGAEGVPLHPPVVPVWSATTVAPYPDDPDAVRDLLIRHLLEPVRFRELALRLYDDGARVFVQVGIGSLTGFLDDTLKGRDHLSVAAAGPRHVGLDQLRRVAAALWVEGAQPRFHRLPTAVSERESAPGASPIVGTHDDVPGQAVTLALGAPLVHLGADLSFDVHGLGAIPRTPVLDHPVLSEFDAGLRDLAAAAADVVAAWRNGGNVAPGAPTSGTAAADDAGTETRELSLASMPFLIDHSFYRQPDGWADASDLFPVVPMTCMLEILGEAAARLMPGQVLVGFEHVRALRWLAVEPPTEVTIDARVAGTQRVRVTIEGYARGTVVFGDSYEIPPAPDRTPFAGAHVGGPTAFELYHDHWSFHGPEYQGVIEIGPRGNDGLQGIIEALPAPGSLLDAAGQLLGHWVALSTDVDRVALPSVIEHVHFFGPPPVTGERFECRVRVRELTPALVRADLQITDSSDRVWAQIEGWQDTRFDTDDTVFSVLREPALRRVAEEQPGGWFLAREHWQNSATRELIMRRYLDRRERSTYAALNPIAQRTWLLGRIALKDAVRHWLWDHGAGPLFPIEIRVENDEVGRPVVEGPFDEDLRVSVAHTEWAAAAIVGLGADVGIDIEPDVVRHDRFEDLTLTEAEAALLDEKGSGRDRALTRLWAVKEAVSKARGTGLEGRPRAIEVTSVVGGRCFVDTVRVDTAIVSGGEGAAPYVVAWTSAVDGERGDET